MSIISKEFSQKLGKFVPRGCKKAAQTENPFSKLSFCTENGVNIVFAKSVPKSGKWLSKQSNFSFDGKHHNQLITITFQIFFVCHNISPENDEEDEEDDGILGFGIINHQ